MNLLYYSYQEDKYYEYNSKTVSKIFEKKNSLNFNCSFELSISKESNSIHIFKNEKIYHLNLIEFQENSQERIGIRIDNLETLNKFIDTYINELDCRVTKNSIEEYHSLEKKREKEKFDNWKVKYQKKRKKEKYNSLKPIFATLLIITLLGVSFYYWSSEEYKFIFSKTNFIKAEIVETKMVHAGSGYYYQKLTYQYEFNNKKFKGEKTIGRSVGVRDIGDFIKLKISIKNPERNKVVGYYYD